MVLGTEAGLSPGDFALDGDTAVLSKKGADPLPNFRPISVVAKRLDASRCHLVWSRPQPRNFVLDGDPALLSPKKGAEPPSPIFGPCLLRSDSYIAQLTRRTRTARFTISEVAVDWQ